MSTRKEERRARREERRARRKQRVQARKQLMLIAAEVYEDGDDVQELKEKITDRLESEFEDDRPFLAFLLELLETFAPILIRILLGL